jgi:tetratricopeptide (TPR) repeat protein
MTDMLIREFPAIKAANSSELRRLIADSCRAPRSHPAFVEDPADGRVFQLDADFFNGGVWAGVDRLIEMAYLDLLAWDQAGIIESHDYELYMVLLKYRDEIQPRYMCLTDTATPAERTRRFPLDRAYRIIHGLVELVIQWKLASGDRDRWVVVVRNFDGAQHLATRFFTELARRAALHTDIDVVIETQSDLAAIGKKIPGMRTVPPAPRIATLRLDPIDRRTLSGAELRTIEERVGQGDGVALEQNFPGLLAHYRARGDGPAEARVAFGMLPIFIAYGYYFEAMCLVNIFLPHFDALVAGDEHRRLDSISSIVLCLGNTGQVSRTLEVLEELAVPHLTIPAVIAYTHYIRAMYYLRYAEVKNVAKAEEYLLQAVELVNTPQADHQASSFFKVFINNGVAFLRARQGWHEQAIELCRSGYETLTAELGEGRHMLHRSVLQYNIAQVYVMLGRVDDAMEHYNKVISMDPYYTEYYNDVGNILQERGRYQEAIGYYALGIKYSAPYPEVHYNKGLCHVREEHWEEAIASFGVSLELNPGHAEAYALRAEAWEGLGQEDAAIADYDSAIEIKPDFVSAMVNRAVLFFNRNSYDRALIDMNHAISLEGGQASHYENRAEIYRAMHREDLYLEDLSTAQRYGASS